MTESIAEQISTEIAELRQADRPEEKTWERGWYDAITAAAMVARTARAETPLRELAEWLVSLDDPDDAAGMAQRRTVTLDQIITRARKALGREE